MYPNTTTPTRTLRLRELPATETPRVRLCDVGPTALSDAELLAILLRSGVAGANALDLARQLLVEHDAAGKLLDVECIDHLILGQGCWLSMRQRGLGFNG